jgi:hypothetical protein
VPRFEAGDRVRPLHLSTPAHVRVPRYTRGVVGVVERVLGQAQNPETAAAGGDKTPEHWVYQIRFSAPDLWGVRAHPNDKVYVDLWEHYLEPVDGKEE